MATVDNLKPDRVPGDILSAEQYNILVDAVRRTITGPNVVNTPGGWHINDVPGMRDRPVVLVKKPGASDKTLIVRQIGYVGRKADAGAYEWASTPFEGVPEFGFKVSDYTQFYWKPPEGVTDPVPDIDASFLYVRFIKGRWLVLKPAVASVIEKFVFHKIVSDADENGNVLPFHFSVMQCFRVDASQRRAAFGSPVVLVALPPHIQRETWSGKSIKGFFYTDEDFPGDPFKRLSIINPSQPGSEPEMQVVSPPFTPRGINSVDSTFYPGDIIKAVSIRTGITIKGIDVEWEDTNDQGRAWLKRAT